MSTVPETPVSNPSSAPGFVQKNKVWFIVIGLFILSNGGVYFYQRFQQNRLLKFCREELDKKTKTAEAMALQRSEEMATTLCRTLVWGIRGEMERGNKELIDLFMNKMVQETGLDLVIIQNVQDSIYLSTDKKYENHKVPYIQGVISQQQVLKSDQEETVVAAPIMGMEARLGTCLIVYKAPKEARDFLDRIRQDSLPREKQTPVE